MSTLVLYLWIDPETFEPFYAGVTKNLAVRYSGYNSHNRGVRWKTQELKSRGLKPIIRVEDEFPEEDWGPLEAAYIEFLRELGYLLYNRSRGGRGSAGMQLSLTTRQAIAEAGRRPCKESTKLKIGAKNRGSKQTSEAIARAKQKYQEWLASPVGQEVMLLANEKKRGKAPPNKGIKGVVKATPEQRARYSEGRREYWRKVKAGELPSPKRYKGVPRSEEDCQAIRASMDDAYRETLRHKTTEYWRRVESGEIIRSSRGGTCG